MAGEYEDIGEFKTDQEVSDWAARNGVNYNDLSIQRGRRLRVSMRRSASDMSDNDIRESRRHGFFG